MNKSLSESEKQEIEPITAESVINSADSRRFTQKDLFRFGVGSLLYFGWFYFFVGLRSEHIFLYVLTITLFFIHKKTQQFIVAFSIFSVYWIMYDSMRVFPNYKVNPIHIEEIYNFEKKLFGVYGSAPQAQKTYNNLRASNTEGGDSIRSSATGIDSQTTLLTLNEYFRIHQTPYLDVLSGLFYLNWVPIPLAFGFWLFRKDKRLFLKFSYAFVFTNVVGFSLYYCYPAAPPWYIEQYGFQVIHGTPGNAAGLIGFDKFFNIRLFEDMYQKNANVFAAMPSLHSAYPLLCFLYGRRLKSIWLNAFFFIFTVGVWFAAIYTRHHYLVDVIAGATVATICYYTFEYLSEKTKIKYWFDNLTKKI